MRTSKCLFLAHLSSGSLNQDHGGSEQGAEVWNSDASTIRKSFPAHWAWARWITRREKILQTGQMSQSPSGGDPHSHGWPCDPRFIWKAWHPVRVQTPPHPATLGDCSHWGGGRLSCSIFSNMKTFSHFYSLAHPTYPLALSGTELRGHSLPV